MSETRSNCPYAQINAETKIVEGVSMLWSVIPKTHPYYDIMIPLREYNPNLLGQRFTGYNTDGYGLFETVEEEPTEQEQAEPEQTEPIAE